MRLVFRELANVLQRLGRENFLKEYPFPFLVQMRDYHFANNSTGLETTSTLDLATLREIIAQAGDMTKYPHEIIYLAMKNKEGKTTGLISIGRDPHNDIILDLPMISRAQMLLRYENKDQSYQIADTGSTNETQVNFDKLPPQTWRALKNSDVICLGGIYNFAFYDPEMMCYVLKKYLAELPMLKDNESRSFGGKEQHSPPRRKADREASVASPEKTKGSGPTLGCKHKF